MDMAHLNTNPLHILPFTQLTISPSTSSVSILTPVPFPSCSPSSPNTKPEPLQGQFRCTPNSGVSGSSCASVLLPMPDSRPRSANYMVKLCKIQIQETSRPSTAFFSYFRSYSHIMWSQMKRKEQAQIHSDLHHGHGTSQHQSSV